MFFFFQAEDGIRDVAVTGVQTCTLPICGSLQCVHRFREGAPESDRRQRVLTGGRGAPARNRDQIWRASCRGRVYISVVSVSLKKKKKNSCEFCEQIINCYLIR